jgi:putative nucleotidyltransferase with HDIG domain
MKTFFILTLFLTLLYSHERETLNVGIYKNPPKIFLDSSGNPSGFFVDILNEIAKRENWKLNYVECQWRECLSMLEEGKLDIMPDVAYSKEREKHFNFNKEVVLSNWSVLFTNKTSKISSILDLDKKKIALLKDSIQHEQIQETFELFGIKPAFILVKSFDESFLLLQNSQADAAIVNRHYGELNKEKFNVKESSILLNPAAIKFAFAPTKSNAGIIDKIDLHIKDLKENQHSIYYTSNAKYLTLKENFKFPSWLKFLFIAISVAILFLVGLIIFFNYMLKLKTKKIIESSAKFEQLEKQKIEDYKKILYALISMIEQRDSYTAGHSQRVAKYSELIAREMGYDDEECKILFKAATLHDIGKIATPDAVLLKPDKLSDLEYNLIKEHVNVGVKMLEGIPMFEEISDIIRFHHEKYDGSGYPKGIAGDDIPPLSRIMMVADAFDAMTTNRIYKHKKSIEEALREIKSLQKIHYHPEVVQSALRALSNINISSEDFNQRPITAVEQHRFVYFYKDSITDLYNVKYLEIALLNNKDEEKYTKALVISLHKFDAYNKKYSWERGDAKLKEFAALLLQIFKDTLIFRVRANDFIILAQDDSNICEQKFLIEDFTKNAEIEFDCGVYDIKEEKIETYGDLKRFL